MTAKWNIADAAARLHASATVCDMVIPGTSALDDRESVIPRYLAAGCNYVSLTIGSDRWTLEQTVLVVAAERARYARHADKYVLVESVDDIIRAKNERKLALGFNFQGTNGLAGHLDMVALYYKLGVRSMLLAYNQKNLVGDGCHERTDAGLSRFGVSLIKEMNRTGMLVDCSHTGYRTSMEAIETSSAPVICSHSNAKALLPHDRNIPDDLIKACARSGGVIGMNGMGIYIADNDASTAALVRHIDYMADLVGPQHIGLGLDFVFYEQNFYARVKANPNRYPPDKYPIPQQFFKPEQLPELTELLLKRGYEEDAVRGILGENFLRVAGSVWKN